jgi:predicted GIY-YIG superfamily endonuclease
MFKLLLIFIFFISAGLLLGNAEFQFIGIIILFLVAMVLSVRVLLEKNLTDKSYKDQSTKKENFKDYSVYAIKNTNNKRIYIGMTSNFNRRKSEHFSPEYRSKEKKMLYKYMQDFGDQSFTMIEIFSGLTKQEASYAEARLIKNWHTIFPYGYNIKEELDNRQLGLNVSIYNRDFFDKVKSIANMEYKNKLLSEEKLW